MSKKLLVAGVMLALVATVLVGAPAVVGAQSMTLCQTVSALVAAGVIAPDKVAAANAAAGCSAAAPVAASYTFTRNLTVGSTGADVTALQTKLGVSPATGYFGAITKAAVVAYQTANGLPATGFVGPLTLAKLNASAVVVTPVTPVTPVSTTCPAGYTCTPASTGTVTTTGTEGTVTVSQSNSGLASSIYEGDSKVGVLGLKIEAKNSDIAVKRINVDLGTSTTIYNKVFNKIYVLDGSTVLASSDLNSNTVTKDSAPTPRYYITLTGINAVIAKNTSKTLVIALDVNGSVDTTYRSRTYAVSLYGTSDTAIRGTDGAGLDEYAGSNGISRNVSVSSSLADSATLKTSLDSSSPLAATVIAADGANQNEADKVTTLVFNVKATKSDITITDLSATTTGTAVNAGEIVTAYLFDGATELDNASVSSTTNVAVFNNLNINIAKDSTKTLTIKVDVRNASANALTVTSMVDGVNGITAENANGDNVANPTGSATGNVLQVQSAGAVYTLYGTPTLVGVHDAANTSASSTYTATFAFDIAASGADVTVGSTSAFVVGIYNVDTGALVASTTAGYLKPTSGIVLDTNGNYVIADGSSARFSPVLTSFVAPQGSYLKGMHVVARLMSATTNLGTVSYIADTFVTGPVTL